MSDDKKMEEIKEHAMRIHAAVLSSDEISGDRLTAMWAIEQARIFIDCFDEFKDMDGMKGESGNQ